MKLNPCRIIRWLIRRDMPSVIEIENNSQFNAWTESDFLATLRQRNAIGMVAEDEYGIIIGYMIYTLQRSNIQVLKLVVGKNARRLGAGTQMINRLKEKLTRQRRHSLLFEINEMNFEAQMFLASKGFNADRVIRDVFPDADDYEIDRDCYQFRFSCVGNAKNRQEQLTD